MKIISMRSIGTSRTFSPEMKSGRHNYITDNSGAVHANSHACAYCLVAYRCLWLKAYFTPEWWAAVMSDCHPDKLVRYMGVARSEETIDRSGTKFSTLNINDLTVNFTVSGEVVNPGLIGIKGIGNKAALQFEGIGDYKSIDEFVEARPKSKTVLERLIKLGSFNHLHPNTRATWMWYLYKYCSGQEVTRLRGWVQAELLLREGWTEEQITLERQQQVSNYLLLGKKTKKVPAKITNWRPKPKDDRDTVMALFQQDFTTSDRLSFERDFLGYYLSNPLDRYQHIPNFSITNAAKEGGGPVNAVVMNVDFGTTKKGDQMCRITLFDGHTEGLLLLWSDECELYLPTLLRAQEALVRRGKEDAGKVELGIGVNTRYSRHRKSFTLRRESGVLWVLERLQEAKYPEPV